jgi:hypothetical protein
MASNNLPRDRALACEDLPCASIFNLPMTTVVSCQIDDKHIIFTLKSFLCQWDKRDLAELYAVETRRL